MKSFPYTKSSVLPCVMAILAVHAFALAQEPETVAPSSEALARKVAELEARVAYLNELERIREVELHYMRGFDRNDEQLLKSAFWPDAQINYQFKDDVTSRSVDEFFRQDEAAHIRLSTHWGHMISNQSIDIDGDTAHVETYLTEFSSFKNSKSRIVSGRYIDRLDRRNGEWRIAVRLFIPHFFTETNNALDVHWPIVGCSAGTWDRRDPSYKRPLLARSGKNVNFACAR